MREFSVSGPMESIVTGMRPEKGLRHDLPPWKAIAWRHVLKPNNVQVKRSTVKLDSEPGGVRYCSVDMEAVGGHYNSDVN